MTPVQTKDPDPRSTLSPRELVILSHLEAGVTLDQVAARLFVSRNTVKTQLRSLYRKLGISTRAEALEWAQRIGG